MARKGQQFQHYSKEFKMKAVKMYEEGNKSYQSLSEELGIKSSTQLKSWVRKFREGKLLKIKEENIQSQKILLTDVPSSCLKVWKKKEII